MIWAALAACGGGTSLPSPTTPRDLPEPVLGEPVTCADPSLRAELAFDVYGRGDWGARPLTGTAYGLAVGDLDGNGFLDLVVPSKGVVALFFGGPDGLQDATAEMPPETLGAFRVASLADIDGDADLDLFLGSRALYDLVLANDGAGHFSVRFALEGLRTMGSSWGDVDRDGDLDLALANGADDDSPPLWINRGDGTFDPRPDLLPASFPVGDTMVAPLIDLDQDGWVDLYRANDTVGGPGNLVAWNRGGRFEADDGSAGLNHDICTMGVGIGDLNGDELPDLALSDCKTLLLDESLGPAGVWVDHAQALNFDIDPASLREVPWGIELADLDNDGDLDAYVGYGFVDDPAWEMAEREKDGLYVQGPDGAFTESSTAWGIDLLTLSRGAVLADLDNDGWLDVIRPNLLGPPDLFVARCGAESWVRVDLRDDTPNPFAVGAKVVAVADGVRRTRWVLAGGTSMASGGPPEVHFGLADASEVTLEVTWPDGEVDTWEDLGVNRRISLRHP